MDFWIFVFTIFLWFYGRFFDLWNKYFTFYFDKLGTVNNIDFYAPNANTLYIFNVHFKNCTFRK